MKFIINYIFFTGLISLGWCAIDFIFHGDELIKFGKSRMPKLSENELRTCMLISSFLVGWFAVPKAVFKAFFR